MLMLPIWGPHIETHCTKGPESEYSISKALEEKGISKKSIPFNRRPERRGNGTKKKHTYEAKNGKEKKCKHISNHNKGK